MKFCMPYKTRERNYFRKKNVKLLKLWLSRYTEYSICTKVWDVKINHYKTEKGNIVKTKPGTGQETIN